MAARKSLQERFDSKYQPEPNTGCWLWVGGLNEGGYGIIGLGSRSEGVARAHRVSWVLHRGPLNSCDCVLHKCDQPRCVNPDHLFVGSQSDNMKDCVQKKRNFVPDNRGEKAINSKLKIENVIHIKKRELSGSEYARMYGVSRSAIYEIWGGRNWTSA
jgi:hypothetical protein